MSDAAEERESIELERLRASVRRLWTTTVVALVVALSSGSLALRQLLVVPDRVEIRDGSRAAVLTPEHLVFTLEGEPRVVLDVHSGFILHGPQGDRARLDHTGVLLHERDDLAARRRPDIAP